MLKFHCNASAAIWWDKQNSKPKSAPGTQVSGRYVLIAKYIIIWYLAGDNVAPKTLGVEDEIPFGARPPGSCYVTFGGAWHM